MARRAGLEKSVDCVGIPTTFPGTSLFFVLGSLLFQKFLDAYSPVTIILQCVLKVWAGFHLRGVLLRSTNESAGSFLTTLPTSQVLKLYGGWNWCLVLSGFVYLS